MIWWVVIPYVIISLLWYGFILGALDPDDTQSLKIQERLHILAFAVLWPFSIIIAAGMFLAKSVKDIEE